MRIAVGGNIGAGKSTFVEKLEKKLGGEYVIAKEPNDICPFLKNFYKNPKKYAFKTQVFFISSRKHSLDGQPSSKIFFDRTIFDDKVFADVQHILGNMDDDEKATYDLFYDALTRDVRSPDLYINMKASPSTCLERIRKRGRSSESSITLEYLNTIDNCYDAFWYYVNENLCPVMEIDAEVDAENMDYQKILDFIQKHQT